MYYVMYGNNFSPANVLGGEYSTFECAAEVTEALDFMGDAAWVCSDEKC